MKRLAWECIYWPLAGLTVLTLLLCATALSANEWALKNVERHRRLATSSTKF